MKTIIAICLLPWMLASGLRASWDTTTREGTMGNLKHIHLEFMLQEIPLQKLACQDAASNVIREVSAEHVFGPILERRGLLMLLDLSASNSVERSERGGGKPAEGKTKSPYDTWCMSAEKWEVGLDFVWHQKSGGDESCFLPILWTRRDPSDTNEIVFLQPHGMVRCLPANDFRQCLEEVHRWLEPERVKPEDLLQALSDSSPERRRWAVRFLGARKEARYVPAIAGCLHDKDPRVRPDAVWALGTIGGSEALKHLAPLTKGKDDKFLLAIALGKIGGAESVPPLADLVKNSNASVRREAVKALGRSNSGDAIGVLVPLLNDPDRHVRFAALDALTQLGWKPSGR